MLTPLDLKNRKLTTIKKKFYDKNEADELLALIYENYKELYEDHEEMKEKMKTLSDGIQYYRSIESTMQKALILAEKTSNETKDAAVLKAEAIEKDASAKAAKIIANAQQEYDQLREKCMYLISQFNQYKIQLKQVATAQLDLVTSDSFEVYSPELEAISQEALPGTSEPSKPVNNQPVIEQPVVEQKVVEQPVQNVQQPQAKPSIDIQQLAQEAEELSQTRPLPDLRAQLSMLENEEANNKSVLTADTIDLSDAVNEVQRREKRARQQQVATNVQDAVVLEPVKAKTVAPKDASVTVPNTAPAEVLEPEIHSETEAAPTLDSLLQNMNMAKKNRKGQEEDPFEFLGSVDDF